MLHHLHSSWLLLTSLHLPPFISTPYSPQSESLDLAKHIDKPVVVKFQGGREGAL